MHRLFQARKGFAVGDFLRLCGQGATNEDGRYGLAQWHAGELRSCKCLGHEPLMPEKLRAKLGTQGTARPRAQTGTRMNAD
jgi:hypothetical protein